MKTSQRILNALAVVFAGQVILIADTPPAPPAPPAPPEAGAEAASPGPAQAVQRELEWVQARPVREVRAQHAVMIAQAGHGDEDEVEVNIEMAEPPEPPEPPDPFGAPHVIGFNGLGMGDAGASVSPLVIPSGPVEPGSLAEDQEDLAIMARILSKAAARGSESNDPMALGIMLSTFPGLRRPQAMHLDGYGAVFLVNVSFPLAAPAAKAQAKPDKPVNTTWEQARRELYGPKGSPRYGSRSSGDVLVYTHNAGRKPAAFDADRVERLQRDLAEALKNGANLRHVKPEENLVVVVTSPAGDRPVRIVKTEVRRSTGGPANITSHEEATSGEGSGPASTLVLRVRKSEADDFAAGKFDFDEFRKRVGVTVY
jgi:hypothetical protein